MTMSSVSVGSGLQMLGSSQLSKQYCHLDWRIQEAGSGRRSIGIRFFRHLFGQCRLKV